MKRYAPLKYGWRVTKYNPTLRNPQGHYLVDEWIDFSNIGKSFAGKCLTAEEYFSCENAYVNSAMQFLADAGLSSLKITDLENYNIDRVEVEQLHGINMKPSAVLNDMEVSGPGLEDVIRFNLRAVLWCRLLADSDFYLHFGYDYYMYVGSNTSSTEAINFATNNGLFVEEKTSPYLGDDE